MTLKHQLSVLLITLFMGANTVCFTSAAHAATAKSPLLTESHLQENQKNLVAHAGGAYDGYSNTNSLEALNTAYNNGFKLIEVDFYKTLDGHYVLLHSDAYANIFGGLNSFDGLSLKQFKALGHHPILTFLTAKDLNDWLMTHQGIRIIGDKIRSEDYIALGEQYSYLFQALIPQVNSLEAYQRLKDYGYQDIIFTVYSTSYTQNPTTIVDLSKQVSLFGLTMPYETIQQLTLDQINDIQQYNKIFTHTINSLFEVSYLDSLHIQGIYTDYFSPKSFVSPATMASLPK